MGDVPVTGKDVMPPLAAQARQVLIESLEEAELGGLAMGPC
jgi:hypothetical protein